MTQEEIILYNGIDPGTYFAMNEIQVFSIVSVLIIAAVIWFVLNNARNSRRDEQQ